jgi:hypothetical protein
VDVLEPRKMLSVALPVGDPSRLMPVHPGDGTTKTMNGTNNPRSALDDVITTATKASARGDISELDAGYPLMSVTFGGEGFRAITSDVDSTFPTYRTEQWLGGNNPHEWPVLYAAGSTLTVSAKWTDAMSAPLTGPILARAATSNGLTIPPTPVKEEAGELLLPSLSFPSGGSGPSAAVATAPFRNGAQFFPHFVIHWQLSFDGGKGWNDAGRSDNPVYVSASTNPLPDALSKEFYLTVVDSEINETLGLLASGRPAIVKNTWRLFTGRGVRQFSLAAPFSDGTEHGRALTYYGTPTSASDPTRQQFLHIGYTGNTTVRPLLAHGDGQCTAWDELFLDMLLVNGIFEQKDWVSVVPEKSDEGFLVNNWHFSGDGTSGNKSYPYLDVLGKHYEVVKHLGAPGQNSPDPLSVFGNHVIVFINGTYYDPSYAETFTNIRQMTAKVVAGYCISVPGKPDEIEIQKRAASGELLRKGKLLTWKPNAAS